MKIPELSLSPRCMLGPDYDIVFVVRFSLAFLIDALDVYSHCTLDIDRPFEAKSLMQTSLQPF
jgi:hypothetical protein